MRAVQVFKVSTLPCSLPVITEWRFQLYYYFWQKKISNCERKNNLYDGHWEEIVKELMEDTEKELYLYPIQR